MMIIIQVYSIAERSSLFDSPMTLYVVHVYMKQLFVGVHYLIAHALYVLWVWHPLHYVYMYCEVFVPVLENA